MLNERITTGMLTSTILNKLELKIFKNGKLYAFLFSFSSMASTPSSKVKLLTLFASQRILAMKLAKINKNKMELFFSQRCIKTPLIIKTLNITFSSPKLLNFLCACR